MANLNIEINKETIKKAKMKALSLDIPLKDYVANLINKDNQ